MKILRSGPFPRKSSGACLFLVGLLGLSSTVLLKRKQVGQTVIFVMPGSAQTTHSFIGKTDWSMYVSIKWNNSCTFLSQSLGIPHFSSHSSSPLCWGYAVKRWDISHVTSVRRNSTPTHLTEYECRDEHHLIFKPAVRNSCLLKVRDICWWKKSHTQV